jgi:hypothetical protein
VDPAWIWLPVGSRALLLLKEASLRSAPRRRVGPFTIVDMETE